MDMKRSSPYSLDTRLMSTLKARSVVELSFALFLTRCVNG